MWGYLKHIEHHATTHTIAYQMCSLDAQMVHELQQIKRMRLDRIVGNTASRVAKARQIWQNNAMFAGKRGCQAGHMLAGARTSMQDNDGQTVGCNRRRILTISKANGLTGLLPLIDRLHCNGFCAIARVKFTSLTGAHPK